MRTSLAVLEQQRQRSGGRGAGDLWQLQIIISDGLCENHERLRQQLRQATEARVLVVFIIIDTRGDSTGNLLSTKQVTFVDGKLVMRDYMDSFPFDYYVVLRDITGLPDVLATALRQWFEMASSQSDV